MRPARLVVATNAFGSTLIPGIDVEPAVNHVLVTDEIPDFEFPHAVHIDAGYVYSRPIENRMLIGGGRHWGLDETATRNRLIALMHELWPATEAAGIAYQWSGLAGRRQGPIAHREAVRSQCRCSRAFGRHGRGNRHGGRPNGCRRNCD